MGLGCWIKIDDPFLPKHHHDFVQKFEFSGKLIRIMVAKFFTIKIQSVYCTLKMGLYLGPEANLIIFWVLASI